MTETRIKWGPHTSDYFAVARVTRDLDGEPIKPAVHLREGLCPDVWLLEPKVAVELANALLAAAKAR